MTTQNLGEINDALNDGEVQSASMNLAGDMHALGVVGIACEGLNEFDTAVAAATVAWGLLRSASEMLGVSLMGLTGLLEERYDDTAAATI